MVYSVSFDFNANKVLCFEVKDDFRADYIVMTNPDQSWFCVYVDAEDEKLATALAELYVRKYIIDTAGRKYQKVFSLTIDYLRG